MYRENSVLVISEKPLVIKTDILVRSMGPVSERSMVNFKLSILYLYLNLILCITFCVKYT